MSNYATNECGHYEVMAIRAYTRCRGYTNIFHSTHFTLITRKFCASHNLEDTYDRCQFPHKYRPTFWAHWAWKQRCIFHRVLRTFWFLSGAISLDEGYNSSRLEVPSFIQTSDPSIKEHTYSFYRISTSAHIKGTIFTFYSNIAISVYIFGNSAEFVQQYLTWGAQLSPLFPSPNGGIHTREEPTTLTVIPLHYNTLSTDQYGQ